MDSAFEQSPRNSIAETQGDRDGNRFALPERAAAPTLETEHEPVPNKPGSAPTWIRWILGLSLLAVGWLAVRSERIRPSYAQRFVAEFPARAVPRSIETLATLATYDARYLNSPPTVLNNDDGELAWQTSYRMAGLNEMYRATRDEKYLLLNLDWANRVMEARDDITGLRRWTGQVGPVWSSLKYGTNGRTAHAVHTATITYPILELLTLHQPSTLREKALVTQLLSSLDAHDGEWRDGPGRDEGHYVYAREQGVELEGKPLPFNRDNAMAKSHWLAWKLSGLVQHRDKALALAWFFRHRLTTNATGAYVWPYEVHLTDDGLPWSPEDMSHGALTASLAPLLAADGKVFTGTDLKRFAATVLNGVTDKPAGMMGGDLEGSEKADPSWVDLPARWLEFAPYHGAIYPRIAHYYESYDASTQPGPNSLALALLIRYRPVPRQ